MNEYINKIQSLKLKKDVLSTLKEFENCIIENKNKGNKDDLIYYINLLYFDTISSQDLKNIENNEELLLALMKNPESYFEVSFEKIFSEINNSNENNILFKNKFKSTLRTQYVDIQKKIKECDEHINILNELFIQKELMQKIPLTSQEKKKFELKNKKVLIYTQQNNVYGELFSRYIFSLLDNPNNTENTLPQNFYDENKIFNFLNEEKISSMNNNSFNGEYSSIKDTIKPFIEWSTLLKFWLIYLLIFEKMFEKDSNIEEITDIKHIMELAKKTREYKSDGDGKKKNKSKKDKKKKGGKKNLSIQNIAKEVFKKKQQKNQKKGYHFSSEANRFKELMKNKILIHFLRNNSNQKKNLNDILNEGLLLEKEKTFYSKIISIPYSYDSIRIIFDIEDKDSNLKLDKLITDKNLREDIKRNPKENTKDNFINNIIKNIRIYQSLYAFKNENSVYIKDFLKKVYDKILFIYYFLYLKKKMIYTTYLEIFLNYSKQHGIILNDLVNKTESENEEEKGEEKNISNRNIERTNSETHKINEMNRTLLNKLNTEKKREYLIIIQKIKYLNNKKEELEKNKNQVNYDKKILIIEKLINELLVQKHQLIHSI